MLGSFLVDAPSPDLVRFILPAPDPDFDRRLASPRLGIVSPRAITAARRRRSSTRAEAPDSGTGPFELRERSADRLLLGAQHGVVGGRSRTRPRRRPARARRSSQTPESASPHLRDGSAEVAELEPSQLAAIRGDPLLTALPDAAGGLGVERSVRGIPSDPVPALNGAWLTTLGAG